MHACTHARMHACTHARMHACTHARMHACTHARMHACTHASINLSVYNLFVNLSIHPPIYPSIHLLICPCIYLSIYTSTSLSTASAFVSIRLCFYSPVNRQYLCTSHISISVYRYVIDLARCSNKVRAARSVRGHLVELIPPRQENSEEFRITGRSEPSGNWILHGLRSFSVPLLWTSEGDTALEFKGVLAW